MPRLNISSSTLTSHNQGGGSSKAGSPSTIGLGRFSKNSIKKRASACKCSTKSSCTTIGTNLHLGNGYFYRSYIYEIYGLILPPNQYPNNLVFVTNGNISLNSVKVGCTLIHNNIEYTIFNRVDRVIVLDKDFPFEGINAVVKCC